MVVLKVALVAFLAVAVTFIVVTGIRRWLKNPRTLDLSDPLVARYGGPMAGNWTPPIEDNVQIVAEETIDDGRRSS